MRCAAVLVALLGGVTLGGCDDATAPEVERVAISAPALYGVWWQEVSACSGRSGSLLSVSWFVAYEFPQGPSILGQWNSRREITLRSDVWLERDVVAHEILHDLLDGDLDHLDPAWQICGIPVGVDTP